MHEAVEYLRQGEVVAFPTETVYGLGANALDEKAVKKIFKAKGRPSDNPIITHVSSLEMFNFLVDKNKLSDDVSKLQKEFWPGPLTLIVYKSSSI